MSDRPTLPEVLAYIAGRCSMLDHERGRNPEWGSANAQNAARVAELRRLDRWIRSRDSGGLQRWKQETTGRICNLPRGDNPPGHRTRGIWVRPTRPVAVENWRAGSHREAIVIAAAKNWWACKDSTPATDPAERSAQNIRRLLSDGRAAAARRKAAEMAARYPDHLWIQGADRILNPKRLVEKPASGRGRTQEFAWLHKNGARHRGQWVALLKGELVASGADLDTVLSAARARGLQSEVLVHHIG